MSDPDAMPDPIDKAYVEAEAVLSDEAARAARRQRVLAAVASQGAPEAAIRPRAWRRGGWLVAASVAGLALVVATQVYRPPPAYMPPPKPNGAPVAAGPVSKTAATAPTPAAPAPIAARPAAVASASAPTRGVSSETETPPVVTLQAPVAPSAFPSTTAPAPSVEAAPAPPPPPPPEVDAARDEAPKAQAASQAPAGGSDNVSEVVVTAEKRESRRQSAPAAISAFAGQFREVFDPGSRLRAAAAGGRMKDLEVLLEHGAPVDLAQTRGATPP